MRSKPALADRAIYALLARTKRWLVARAALPRIDVGAATGSGYADEFYITWPPSGKTQLMTIITGYGCPNKVPIAAIAIILDQSLTSASRNEKTIG